MTPYEILGVSESATDDEIKQAYRRLAIQYHPDRNAGNASAEAKFKEIQSAYDAIKDQESRNKLRGGSINFNPFEDGIFAEIFGRQVHPVLTSVVLSFTEPARPNTKEINYTRTVPCNVCQGSGVKTFSTLNCAPCGGRGYSSPQIAFLQVRQTCTTCKGHGRSILEICTVCHSTGHVPENKKLSITIPSGVFEGQIFVFAKQGNILNNGRVGDLHVAIKIIPDNRWERDGADVISSIKITYPQLVLGTQTQVETIWGLENVNIPPGTKPTDAIRLARRGFPGFNRVYQDSRIENGDHICQLDLEIPSSVTPELRALLETLEKHIGNP